MNIEKLKELSIADLSGIFLTARINLEIFQQQENEGEEVVYSRWSKIYTATRKEINARIANVFDLGAEEVI